MNRIVFSSDATPLYAWFLPLTAAMWQSVGKRAPLVLLVGTEEEWRRDRAVILDALLETGAAPVYVPAIDGWRTDAVAQLARLCAYLLPGVAPDDDLQTVDVDAWPLQSEAFAPRARDLSVMRPGEWGLIPIGYIWGRAAAWRELMGLTATTIEAALLEIGGAAPGWGHDESVAPRQFGRFPADRVEIIERPHNCRGTRLDRDGWPRHPIPLTGYIDAHLLRPGWTDENWPRLRWVLERLLPPERMAWADAYRARYLETCGG